MTRREGATKRVWQTLPRHLRRRAASHDPRRVPARLRLKAKSEVIEGPKPGKRKSSKDRKPGKGRKISRTEILLRRQRKKAWLESHIWHAKRMKMTDQWGYRLALHTSEKSFRMSHRAALNGSILNDISYFSTLEIRGPEDLLRQTLKSICDPSDLTPSSKRYSSGARVCETTLYHFSEYPLHLIGPATIMWKPLPDSDGTLEFSREPCSTETPHLPANPSRIVWVRFHPALFDDVRQALKAGAAAALDSSMERSEHHSETHLDIIDLRGSLNAFEIMGPRTGEILRRVLRIVRNEKSTSKAKALGAIFGLQSSGSVPQGLILHATVWDPRLQYVTVQSRHKASGGSSSERDMLVIQPSPDLAQGSLWEAEVRDKLRSKKFKNADLNERRRKHAVPGNPLKPCAEDDRIPCILIQRSIGVNEHQSGVHASSSPSSMHGWILLLPAGWSMPFLNSLVHAGAKVGGLRERQTQHFEASPTSAERFFPNDYVTSCEYDLYTTQVVTAKRAKWERTPPAKRFNYKILENSEGLTYDRWTPDWESLLAPVSDGSQRAPIQELPAESPVPSPQLSPHGTSELPTSASVLKAELSEPVRPWLLLGSGVRLLVQSIASAVAHGSKFQDVLYSHIVKLRRKRGLDPEFSILPDTLFSSSLISVNVYMVGRGCPKDNAVLYELTCEEMIREQERLKRKRSPKYSLTDEEEVDVSSASFPGPPCAGTVGPLLGFVTTGRFSLTRGRGHAVAAISLSAFLRILTSLK
ncbi:uncharacterized protein EI90DRAFT_2906355 [Cantharellus anzutake]|uniref:uncharacterized protein n=1 Tax=Cantharellus anzutake TaxID=1750568 RepID=UPI001906338C|nr:uncharacterized protein EI90DRAFT_2906355 [Cantharellus anzutake]KAF8340372.1 hypothetical protein EI90DRAFT_2906355 [Cantharellus anzutake]